MAIHLQPATRPDVSDLARIFGAAFSSTPQWRWIIPDDQARATILPALLRPSLEQARNYGILTTATVDGALVGGAAWLPSDRLDIPLWGRLPGFVTILKALRGKDLKQFGERGPLVDAAARRAHPKTLHRYLAGVAVTPTRQGTGVGTALLEEGLHSSVTHLHPAAYLECAEDLVPYYERFGFRCVRRIDPGQGAPVQIGMTRPAGM